MAHLSVLPTVFVLGLPLTLLLSETVRRRNRPTTNFPTSTEALIAQGAAKAIARARSRYGLTLDYSHQSMRHVETMLAELHEVYAADPHLVDIHSMAFVLGCYIGETVRKNNPSADWEYHLAMGGYPHALRCGEQTCFPMEWCMTRMIGNEHENVWTKYRLLVHQPKTEEAPVRLKALSASAGRI